MSQPMPQSLMDRLSRFTPDGSGLDRDALLFNAGRASVRPQLAWMLTAGALAACQVLTLALMWPRSAPTSSREIGTSPPHIVNSSPPLGADSEISTLNSLLASKNDDLPPLAPNDDLVPSDPPLTAYSNPSLAGMD